MLLLFVRMGRFVNYNCVYCFILLKMHDFFLNVYIQKVLLYTALGYWQDRFHIDKVFI